MVIGPTPPAPGEPAGHSGLVARHVAAQAGVGAVDADVDHGRARLDPVAADHLGRPRRRPGCPRAAELRSRSRVFEWATAYRGAARAVSSSAIGLPTIRLRPTTTALAPSIEPGAVEQPHDPGRRARDRPGRRGSGARGDGREAVHVLVGVDAVRDRHLRELVGHRELHQHLSVDESSAFSRRSGGGRSSWVVVSGSTTRREIILLRRPRLAGLVELRRRVVADLDAHQPRRPPVGDPNSSTPRRHTSSRRSAAACLPSMITAGISPTFLIGAAPAIGRRREPSCAKRTRTRSHPRRSP